MSAASWAPVAVAVLVIAVARAAGGRRRPLGFLTGRPGPSGLSARPDAAGRCWWLVPALVVVAVVLALLVLGLAGTLALGGAVVGLRALAIRHGRRQRTEAIDRAVPDLVDLLAVAAGVGQPVRSCVEAVADRAPVVLRPALRRVRQQCRRGVALRTALDELGPKLGTQGPALVEALVASHQSGSPLADALAHLAANGRDLRRRSAEAHARRLPVTLLFPLVCCILPAFALLAVVPLLAGSLSGLRP